MHTRQAYTCASSASLHSEGGRAGGGGSGSKSGGKCRCQQGGASKADAHASAPPTVQSITTLTTLLATHSRSATRLVSIMTYTLSPTRNVSSSTVASARCSRRLLFALAAAALPLAALAVGLAAVALVAVAVPLALAAVAAPLAVVGVFVRSRACCCLASGVLALAGVGVPHRPRRARGPSVPTIALPPSI